MLKNKYYLNNRNLLLLVALSISLFSCEKNTNNKNATVIKDCTGTYIRYQEKDYQVCNTSTLFPYGDGKSIKVTFKRIDACNNPESTGAVCMMYHENEGWVEIISVN